MASATQESGESEYTIRPFEPGDGDPFISLYESIFEELPREQFEWKFGNGNPFYDEVPIMFAERDGELVGAKPHIPLRLRAGETTALCLVGTDTMVHEDHRRRGLFSRMTAATMERYADREPAITMNHPTPNSRRGYRKQGWYFLGNLNTTAYRVQDAKVYARRFGGTLGDLVGPIADAVRKGAYSLLSNDSASSGVTVEVDPTDPAEDLGNVPRRDGDPKFHVERDETFYRWWFDELERSKSDEADLTVYVARRGGDPVAGAIVTTYSSSSYPAVEIEDVVPVASETEDAVAVMIERILADARDAAVVSVPTNAVSSDLRRAFGFVDQISIRRAFSRVGLAGSLPTYVTESPIPLALRPFGDQFAVGGVAVTDPENWLMTNPEYI